MKSENAKENEIMDEKIKKPADEDNYRKMKNMFLFKSNWSADERTVCISSNFTNISLFVYRLEDDSFGGPQYKTSNEQGDRCRD